MNRRGLFLLSFCVRVNCMRYEFLLHLEEIFELLTRDAGDSLLAPIDRMFLLDPRPKIDRDRIYCRGLDSASDLYASNDPNCGVALMLRPVLVWPLNTRNRTP